MKLISIKLEKIWTFIYNVWRVERLNSQSNFITVLHLKKSSLKKVYNACNFQKALEESHAEIYQTIKTEMVIKIGELIIYTREGIKNNVLSWQIVKGTLLSKIELRRTVSFRKQFFRNQSVLLLLLQETPSSINGILPCECFSYQKFLL